MAEPRPRRPRASTRVVVPLLAVGLALVAAVGGREALASSPQGGGRYRTAAASYGAVEQSLVLTGTAQPVDRVTASFPVSGKVVAVLVGLGDQVSAGQHLATIDAGPLDQAVLDARAQVAQAELAVENASASTSGSGARAGNGASGSGASGSGASAGVAATPTATPTATPSATSGARTSGGTGAPSGKVSTTEADKLVAAVQAALAAQRTACAPVLAGAPVAAGTGRPQPSPNPSPPAATPDPSSPAATPDPSAGPSTGTTPDPSALPTGGPATPTSSTGTSIPTGPASPPHAPGSGPPTPTAAASTGDAPASPTPAQIAACVAALTRVADAEARAGTALTSVATALDAAARAAAANATVKTTTTARATAAPTGTSGGTTTSAAAVDARVMQAQSSLLSAQQALATAESNRAAATLTAPIAGQIGTLPFTLGATATTASGITIVGEGATEVTVNVPLTNVAAVKVGQKAQVSPAGSAPVVGTVNRIGMLPSSASGAATPTYPVVILVPGRAPGLESGARVQAAIVTSSVARGLVVPVSAVTRTAGDAGTVQVLVDGQAQVRQVTLGAVGTTTAQVVQGLAEGDQVVVADAEQPLPANNSQLTRRFGAGAGGLGGTGNLTGGSGGPAGPGGAGIPGGAGNPGGGRPGG